MFLDASNCRKYIENDQLSLNRNNFENKYLVLDSVIEKNSRNHIKTKT